MRDLTEFYARSLTLLSEVAASASRAEGAEEAMAVVTAAAAANLGDRVRARDEGNLKEGETDQYACGMFFVLPGGETQILIAPQNYGPDQIHMQVATDVGHPGWVVRNQKPLLLKNTDLDSGFVKILKTFRAGSVCYAPIMWNDTFLGQIICAGQARNVMDEPDLAVLVGLANLAAALWIAQGGPTLLPAIALQDER